MVHGAPYKILMKFISIAISIHVFHYELSTIDYDLSTRNYQLKTANYFPIRSIIFSTKR